MARKRARKIEPSILKMSFSLPAQDPDSAARYYIDLSQCASLMNRRFYRQGINWAVNGFKILTDINGFIYTNKLPTTWVMSNAWEKGFRAWQRMNNEALAESESVRPKFLDFKVFANANHHNDGFGANLLPMSFDNNVGPLTSTVDASPGEWKASKFVVPLGNQDPGDTEEFEIVATGASYPGNSPVSTLNAVSLIEGYASSRGLPNVLDPNVPADSADAQGIDPENWLQAIFNEGTDQSTEVLETMITENNIAPYPFENDGTNLDTMYPGGANQLPGLMIHDTSRITATTIGGETYIPGGMFPCGLIELIVLATNENNGATFEIELVPGDHRGYLCEPMTEM